MANGDAAAAEGIPLVPSSSPSPGGPGKVRMGYDQMNRILDVIVAWGLKPATALGISRGGTGATTAAAARTALDVPSWSNVAPPGNVFNNQIARFSSAGRLQVVTPATSSDVATKGYVDAMPTPTSGTNLTLSGHLYVPNAVAAASGYVVAYINGDGRLSKGASSRRFKKNIGEAPGQGDLFAVPLSEFEMKDGDGVRILGYIAEDLAESPDLARFVVWETAPDGQGGLARTGNAESIDFIQLLLAQVAQLADRVKELEARDAT